MNFRFSFVFFFGLVLSLLLQSCAGGGGDGGSISTTCTLGTGASVTISGDITFDRVPHHASTYGLDYNNTVVKPARGVVVEAVCGSTTITAVTTDASGHYSLTVPANTDAMFIRVKAQMLQTGTPAWDFQVVDNTSGQALYSMAGAVFNSGTASSIRNLHADDGWTGASYGSTRVAAPFAILDSVYTTINKILAVNAATQFPALKLNWSINNSTVSGNIAAGQIGTSAYDGTQIYILGDEDSDTDEYDEHVIVHEWGHYFEDTFSRSDSIGGYHALSDYLDMRVAFSEGFGNAFSAIILDDPVYKDAHSTGQASLFDFDIEGDACSAVGWYSECSVQEILYDLYDAVNDAADTLSLGFSPIYNVLINEQRTSSALTSIFPFVTALKVNNPGDAAGIAALFSSHSINDNTDEYGINQSNNTSAATANVLPVYTTIVPGQTTASPLCTTDDFSQVYSPPDIDNFNKLTSTRFLKLTVTVPKPYTITATLTSNPAVANSPGLGLYYGADATGWIAENYVSNTNSVSLTRNLQAGVYIIESYDMEVSDTVNPAASACYSIHVSP